LSLQFLVLTLVILDPIFSSKLHHFLESQADVAISPHLSSPQLPLPENTSTATTMASLLRTVGRVRAAVSRTNAYTASKAPITLQRRHASAAAAAVADGGQQPFFPDEPREPIVNTAIPGPESRKAIERLSKVFDTRSLNMMADYSRSYGN
jgi:hypothetical protein